MWYIYIYILHVESYPLIYHISWNYILGSSAPDYGSMMCWCKKLSRILFFVCWSSEVERKSLNPGLASGWSDQVRLSSDWLNIRLITLSFETRPDSRPGLWDGVTDSNTCPQPPPVICPLIGWLQSSFSLIGSLESNDMCPGPPMHHHQPMLYLNIN